MFIAFMRLRYCKANLTAYVNGQLSPRARRRIARYIDIDAACYAEYVRQRELARELNHSLPYIGQPTQPQLDRVWGAIQAEIGTITEIGSSVSTSAPTPALASSQQRYTPHYMQVKRANTRFGLVGIACGLVMALPVMLGNSNVSALYVPTPPEPQLERAFTVAEMVSTDANGTSADSPTRAVTEATSEPLQPETAEIVYRATPAATQK